MSSTMKFEVGDSVAMAGRARDSEQIQYLPSDQKLLQVGDDAGIVLPEHNVFGLFDGAGGASDIGSPRLAAKVACEAVEYYFNEGGQSIAEAMECARQAVIANNEAGICVGAIARIVNGEVSVVNVGDTAIALYRDGVDDEELYIAEPQRDESWGDPLNYLGLCDTPGRLPERVSDDFARCELSSGDMLFLMTDGAWSVRGELLESYHLAAALNDWPLFEQLKASLPGLEREIRQLLRSDAARELCEREIIAATDVFGRVHEDYVGAGLLDPDRYIVDDTDWLIWQEVIRPRLESLHVTPRRKIGVVAIAGALLSRPIRWTFEAPVRDDATAIVVKVE